MAPLDYEGQEVLDMVSRSSKTLFPVCVVLVAMGVLAQLGGCASIPDVTVSYRPVKWALLVTTVHTIACKRGGDLPLVERGAAFQPIYSADTDKSHQLKLGKLDRWYADADIAITLAEDGRLKSINAATVGQGEAIIKGVIAAAAAVAAMSPAAAAPPAVAALNVPSGAPGKPLTVCDVVRKRSLAAADQVPQVSLIQHALVTHRDGSFAAKVAKDQIDLAEELAAAGFTFAATVVAKPGDKELQPVADIQEKLASDDVPLTLQRMNSVAAVVSDHQGVIDSRSMATPMGSTFELPIPKAALFGKQSFSLVLADSGRITSIGYGSTTGMAGALGALTAAAGAEVTMDNAEAASLKAASDLVAQQQRYINCKLKPAECK